MTRWFGCAARTSARHSSVIHFCDEAGVLEAQKILIFLDVLCSFHDA
jgi:hypothetical protein